LRQVGKGSINDVNQRWFERATRTTHGAIKYTHRPVPFHLLTSVIDITQENEEQVLRIVSQSLPAREDLADLRAQLEPRFTCALNWITNYLPNDERTHVRTSFHTEAYKQLAEIDRASLSLFVSEIDEYWNLNGLTDLMYRVPKVIRGFTPDMKPNDDIKQAQRSFFVALYTLICDSDTGPRIPTLLLSIGLQRVKMLLTPEEEVVVFPNLAE
jgi:lysyl-tRNA synthetase class 1